MTLKQFKTAKIISAIIVAAVVSQTILAKNYILPAVVVIAVSIFLIFLKKQVKEVVADERDYEIAGHAARWAMNIFSLLACVLVFLLFALRDTNPYYQPVGAALAYSVCFMLIIYSLIFKYYAKLSLGKNRKIYAVIGIIIIIIMAVFGLRLFSGEDNWICQNHQWVRHGQPDFPAPTLPCK
jgi:uncharacterized membrane protein